MTPSELIDHIRSGRSMSVAKTSSGQRQIVLASGGRGGSARVPIGAEAYDQLMTGVIDLLAQRHGKDLTVDVKIDFYGGQWLEIRSGLLSRRTARMGLSPRYIARLQDALAERAKQLETA